MSLRERKKLATRTALIATARRLFAKRGYDNVTLEDICQAVPVHTTTFFSYFGSKEELAFAHQLDALAEFRELLKNRPAGSDVLALWWSFRDNFGQQVRGEEAEVLSQTDHVPALRNRQADIVRQYVEEISRALAEDASGEAADELYANLYASAFMAVYLSAARWFASKFGQEIENSDTAGFAKLIMSKFPTRDEIGGEFERIRKAAKKRRAGEPAPAASPGRKSAVTPSANVAIAGDTPRPARRSGPKKGRSAGE